jgi:hypothetical protein
VQIEKCLKIAALANAVRAEEQRRCAKLDALTSGDAL